MDGVLDYVFAPTTWWVESDLNPLVRWFTVLPISLVQVLAWLAFSSILIAVVIGPWVALGLLMWWLV